MMTRYRLSAFFLLAFVLSWYPWFFALIRGTTTGPNPLGPMLAAILVTAFTEKWSGVKRLLARIVQWRVSAKWYAAALLIPVLIVALAAALNIFSGAPGFSWSGLKWMELPERFIFIFLFIGLGEETGWRGFALERLQEKHSALVSSLILGPIWALWHLPLIGSEIQYPLVLPFILGVFSATIFQTWLYNRAKGSVLLPMLLHTTVNAIGAGFVFTMFQGNALLSLWWIYTLLWMVVAIGILAVSGIERNGFTIPFPFRVARSGSRNPG